MSHKTEIVSRSYPIIKIRDEFCEDTITILNNKHKKTVLAISKINENENIVIVEANYDDNGIFDPKKPLSTFWLDLDMEVIKTNRANGKIDGRDPLSALGK